MKKTISTVESFTGGLMAATIVTVPGSSAYFKGSLVAYSNEIKEKNGIKLHEGSPYHPNVALSMAKVGKKMFDTDYCISFTGRAGGDDHPENGKVWIAINDQVKELTFQGNRDLVRLQAVQFALNWFKELTGFDLNMR